MIRHSLVILLVLSASASSQLLQSGDLGIVGFQTNRFWVRKANGVMNTVIITNAPYFGGYSTATTQSILWDPTVPNSFLIAGFGFLGRATLTTATTATWAPVVPAFGILPGEIAQMSWDGPGTIHLFDAASDTVQTIELATGVMNFVTPAFAAWGFTLNAGTYDGPARTWYVGNDTQVWKYTSTGGVVPLANLGWYSTGILRDPRSVSIVVASGPNNRLVRISPCGNIEDLTPPAAITGPNSVVADQNGDFLVGDTPGGTFFRVWRVPNAGGVPVLLSTITTSPSTGQSGAGLAFVGPTFNLSITSTVSGDRELRVSGIPAGTAEGWTFVSATTTSCANSAPFFGIVPDFLTWQLIFGSLAASPGNPVHWVPVVPPTLFPSGPFVLPAAFGAALSGQVWDFSVVTLNALAVPTAWNVQRCRW